MKWHWKVRIYHTSGDYAFCQITTERDLREIDLIQDFYHDLTGCKFLIEGMSEQPFENLANPLQAFEVIWRKHSDR